MNIENFFLELVNWFSVRYFKPWKISVQLSEIGSKDETYLLQSGLKRTVVSFEKCAPTIQDTEK